MLLLHRQTFLLLRDLRNHLWKRNETQFPRIIADSSSAPKVGHEIDLSTLLFSKRVVLCL